MCRSIKTLRGTAPATDEEVRAAALQFVRKISGFRAPAPANAQDGSAPADGQRLTMTMRVLAPQISFNFGSRDGWSYLSAGLGIGSVNTEATEASPGTQESGLRRSVNFGGGARWFIKPRVAFSVDLRAHRMAGGDVTPRVSVFAVSAGMSIR